MLRRSDKTIYEYLEIAEKIPDSVKKLFALLTRENFGVRHAEQLLRLKDDADEMLKAAQHVVDEKPTSPKLKTWMSDYLKIQEKADSSVKEASEGERISIEHVAARATYFNTQ